VASKDLRIGAFLEAIGLVLDLDRVGHRETMRVTKVLTLEAPSKQ
jgi:hypothetical protein